MLTIRFRQNNKDEMEICFTNVYLLFPFRFGQLLTSLNHSNWKCVYKCSLLVSALLKAHSFLLVDVDQTTLFSWSTVDARQRPFLLRFSSRPHNSLATFSQNSHYFKNFRFAKQISFSWKVFLDLKASFWGFFLDLISKVLFEKSSKLILGF